MTRWWEIATGDQAGQPARARAVAYYRHSAQDRAGGLQVKRLHPGVHTPGGTGGGTTDPGGRTGSLPHQVCHAKSRFAIRAISGSESIHVVWISLSIFFLEALAFLA